MNKCPVCGYDELREPAYDCFGDPSFEICPCCGIEFGYEDASRSHESLRNDWIAKGMHWHSSVKAPPPGWDPVQQLRSVTNHSKRATAAPGSVSDDMDARRE
jgi:hypothetical protein